MVEEEDGEEEEEEADSFRPKRITEDKKKSIGWDKISVETERKKTAGLTHVLVAVGSS